MKKRIIAMLLAIAMTASFAACGASSSSEAAASSSSEAATGLVSGTFTADTKGMGDMTVSVTLTDSVITDVTVDAPNETEGIGSPVVDSMPGEIVAGNTVAIDAVAGATLTSNGILEGVKAALVAAGLNPEDYNTAVEEDAGEDVVLAADVVIVGAGGAGMTAAITAADAGKSVIVLESQAMVGGNSVRATGGMNAAKTPYQDENTFDEAAGVEKMLATAADKYADNETITALAATVQEQWDAYQAAPEGYFDSTELMQLDTLVGGGGVNNPTLVATLVNGTADGIEWLKSIGSSFINVASFGGASVKRIHRPVNDEGLVTAAGATIVPVLESVCADRGVEILLETSATEVIMEDGKAVGVHAVEADGSLVTVNAGAVILAAGGFASNQEMVVEYKPELAGFATTNAAGIQGDGIKMGIEAGAATVDMEQIQIHPTVECNTAALITEGLRGDGAILVNAEGARFFDEVGTRDAVSAAVIAQTDSFAWLVVDQKMVDASAVIQGYIKKGFTLSGETAEELAAAIEANPETLAATLTAWNEAVANHEDPEFGRTSFAEALDVAPYYAIKITPGVHHTMGGLMINEATEVLAEDGTAIAGLFAAGEVTGGVHGANRLGGNAVADFVVFGRIAGDSASAYVG